MQLRWSWRTLVGIAACNVIWAVTSPAADHTLPSTQPAAATERRIIIDDPPASTWEQVTFKPIDTKKKVNVRAYIEMIQKEFARHSPVLIQRSGLRDIVIVDQLKVRGQPRAAVPDYALGRLYLDPSVGHWNTEYQRHAVHHEFFHLIQGRIQDDAYFKDSAWIALNRNGTMAPADYRRKLRMSSP